MCGKELPGRSSLGHAPAVRTAAKYFALQLPSWTGVGLVLWLLWRFWELPAWLAFALLAAFVAKDVALFPLLRHAYGDEPSRMVGAEALVGAAGVAEGELAPSGWVRVRGERWSGDLLGGGSLADGKPVVVRSLRGLRLQVEPAVQQTGDS
jgi:membrane-bound ClpP family serine protease